MLRTLTVQKSVWAVFSVNSPQDGLPLYGLTWMYSPEKPKQIDITLKVNK